MTKKKAEAQLRILNAHTDVIEHVGGFIKTGLTPRQANLTTDLILSVATSGLSDLINLATGKEKKDEEYFSEQERRQAAAAYWNARRAERDEYDRMKKLEEEVKRLEFQALYPDVDFKQRGKDIQAAIREENKRRSGVGHVYTAEELSAAADVRKADAENKELSRMIYEAERKKLTKQLNDERIAKQRQTVNEQNQQYLSGLNQESAAVQRQTRNVKEAVEKARILQQQRFQDQKLFLTKANDIRRRDFFDKERATLEARRAMIDAEQRRQAIRAAAAQRAAAPPVAAEPGPATTTSGMVPTLGRRLPPSVLWHG
jgi:hypothetical protein